MKVRRFYSPAEPDYEILNGPSETIPDQSLSVRDILHRFTRGQMVIPPIETGDDEDFDSPDPPQTFDDLVDAQEFLMDSRMNLEAMLHDSRNPPEVEPDHPKVEPDRTE